MPAWRDDNNSNVYHAILHALDLMAGELGKRVKGHAGRRVNLVDVSLRGELDRVGLVLTNRIQWDTYSLAGSASGRRRPDFK